MATQKEHKNRIPKFKSEDEEARFWDTHSPLDYPDVWKDDELTPLEKPLVHTLAVRLNAETIDKLSRVSRRKGIGPSTLARMWILERLAGLEKQERERAVPQQSNPSSL